MKFHTSNNTRHPAASLHSISPADTERLILPQRPQQPAERRDWPPTAHAEKIASRRLHRKQAAQYIGTSLSWLDKSRLKGDGPAFLQVGGRVIYDEADLDA